MCIWTKNEATPSFRQIFWSIWSTLPNNPRGWEKKAPLSNSFSSKLLFLMKTFYFEAMLTYFEKKKKLKNFMLKYFFQKIPISNFLKTFYYSQRNEWHRWTLGTIMKVKSSIWEISYQSGSNFSAESSDPTWVKLEQVLS